MTTGKTDQPHEHGGKWAFMDCCSPRKCAEMMAKCKDMKGKCDAMMQEMMKGESSQPEQK